MYSKYNTWQVISPCIFPHCQLISTHTFVTCHINKSALDSSLMKNTPNHIGFLCRFAICVPWKGVKLNGIPRTPVARLRATNLCTFSMAATSASAARLKNADTAGISGVLLRVSVASLPCAHSSLQPVPGTFGRRLCSCSFGLSSVMKGKPITRGSFCSLQRKDRENSVPDNLK